MYLAPQNTPRAIIVLTLGNKVILLLLSVTYSHTPATDRRQQCKPQSYMYSHTQATHRQQCNITHVQSHVLSCSSSLSMASRLAQKSSKRCLSGQSYRLDEKQDWQDVKIRLQTNFHQRLYGYGLCFYRESQRIRLRQNCTPTCQERVRHSSVYIFPTKGRCNEQSCYTRSYEKRGTHPEKSCPLSRRFRVASVCLLVALSQFKSCVKVEVAVLGFPS